MVVVAMEVVVPAVHVAAVVVAYVGRVGDGSVSVNGPNVVVVMVAIFVVATVCQHVPFAPPVTLVSRSHHL